MADIFAGAGYYSEIIGQVVSPGGEVLMQNNKAYLAYVGKALEKRFDGRVVTGVNRHDREVDNLDLGESNLDAAMIVMATHGYSGVKHMLLGSTTEEVLRHADCPVLSVRSK